MGDWAQANDSGSSGYTAAEREAVVRILEEHRGEKSAVSRKDVCLAAHIEGRTLRAITAAIDDDESLPIVVGLNRQKGLIWARASFTEHDDMDDLLDGMARSLESRKAKRRRKLARACAAQPLLFDLQGVLA